METKACDSCGKSKRKCGKEKPTCHRCASRGINCVYPPIRLSSFVLQQDEPGFGLASLRHPSQTTSNIDGVAADPVTAGLSDLGFLFDLPDGFDMGSLGGGGGGGMPLHDPMVAVPPAGRTTPSKSAWFLAPETWVITQFESRRLETVTHNRCRLLTRFINTLKSWLATYSTTGKSPIVHGVLYRYRLPECVQDAYASLAMYQARTPQNSPLVRHILGERVDKLIRGGATGGGDWDWEGGNSEEWRHMMDDGGGDAHDAFERLARVQALHIYQFIGFFDGDVGLRRRAELAIPTMTRWLRELIASAPSLPPPLLGFGPRSSTQPPPLLGLRDAPMARRQDDEQQQHQPMMGMGNGRSAGGGDGGTTTTITSAVDEDERLWYTWAVAESLRRTWTLANLTQNAYRTVRDGVAECAGAVPFTTWRGLWDAPSSLAWRRLLADLPPAARRGGDGGPALMDVREVVELTRPEEVDPFCQLITEVTFGLETAERWGLSVYDDV